MQTSVAQVFNERGEGVVIRGGQALVVKDDKTVHMDAETTSELLANPLRENIPIEERQEPLMIDWDEVDRNRYLRGNKR